MKEEKDIFEQFRGKDPTSSVRPSKQAWEKLSSKLDDFQKPQVKQLPLYRRFKTWSIAAGILMVLGMAAIIIPMSSSTGNNEATAQLVPLVIEDLDYAKPSGFYALAIRTNKYYNKSPQSIASIESTDRRLQITERKTRNAEQPSYLAEAKVEKNKKEKIRDKKLYTASEKESKDYAQVEENTKTTVERQASMPAASGATEEAYVADLAMAPEVSMEEENIASSAYGLGNVEAEKLEDAVTLSEAPAIEYSKSRGTRKPDLNAASNVMTYDAKDVSSPNIDYFKWLIGEWKTKERNGQFNKQNWVQQDEFTLSGTAVLSINGTSLNVENLMIKKIDDQLYFLRVNDVDGNTLTYQLKSLDDKAAIFTNTEFGDEIRLEQQSNNKFRNGFISNGSLQMSQYPGVSKEEVDYKRVGNR